MKLNLGYPELINQPEVLDAIFMNVCCKEYSIHSLNRNNYSLEIYYVL